MKLKLNILLPIILAVIRVAAQAQNFVTNGDFEGGNIGFSSEYTFVDSNLTEGEYGIVTDPKPWNIAVDSFGDHTSGNGKMLVVNGKTDGSSPVVWSQLLNVGPNRMYFFSSWAANLSLRPSSQFVFRINGVTQQPSIILPIEPALWQNYTVIWESGVSTSALLEIIIVSTEFVGNDAAFDDIVFREANSLPIPVTIEQAVRLEWSSSLGLDYQIQSSTDIKLWSNIGFPIAGTGNPMTHCEKITS